MIGLKTKIWSLVIGLSLFTVTGALAFYNLGCAEKMVEEAAIITIGVLDESFGIDGAVVYGSGDGYDGGMSIITDAAGRILVAGFHGNGTEWDMAVWRYTTSGDLDPSFGSNGVAVYDGGNGNDSGYAIAIDSSGRILVAGYRSNGTNDDIAVWRYDSDGNLDASFGTNGVAIYDGGSGNDNGNSLALDPSGKILVAGSIRDGGYIKVGIVRFDGNGDLDTTFGNSGVVTYSGGQGNDFGRSIAIDASGKLLIAGYVDTDPVGTDYDILLLRYSASGNLDASFGVNGVVTYEVDGNDYGRSVAIDAVGRILVTGYSGAVADVFILRYDANGDLDTNFGNNGVVTYDGGSGNDYAHQIKTDPSGRILVVGKTHNGSDTDVLLLRYMTNGSPDAGFGANGVVTYERDSQYQGGNSIVIDTTGKILLAGYTDNGTDDDMIILRYK